MLPPAATAASSNDALVTSSPCCYRAAAVSLAPPSARCSRGHIHVPLDVKRDGMHYINGGQGYPSFRVPGTIAWIETTPGGLFTTRIETFAPHL